MSEADRRAAVPLQIRRMLTGSKFQQLAEVPPESEWFANIGNLNTRRAYEADLREFIGFAGIQSSDEFRLISRAHVLAWCADLNRRDLAGSTLRRKLAALSGLFEYLYERNAVAINPVNGVKRPQVKAHEGKTQPLGNAQTRLLLTLPAGDGLKPRRDRALLSVLFHHGLGRNEICSLAVSSVFLRRSKPQLCVHGNSGKVRDIPLHSEAHKLLLEYLEASGHAHDKGGPLFRPIRNNRTQTVDRPLSTDGVYKIVRGYSAKLGIPSSPRVARVTAATNALDNGTDIAKVQEWLGHAAITTTRVYDRRRRGSEESPPFKVSY